MGRRLEWEAVITTTWEVARLIHSVLMLGAVGVVTWVVRCEEGEVGEECMEEEEDHTWECMEEEDPP